VYFRVRVVGVQGHALGDAVDGQRASCCPSFLRSPHQIETPDCAEEQIGERLDPLRKLQRVAALRRVELIDALQLADGLHSRHRHANEFPCHASAKVLPGSIGQIIVVARDLHDGFVDGGTESFRDLFVRCDYRIRRGRQLLDTIPLSGNAFLHILPFKLDGPGATSVPGPFCYPGSLAKETYGRSAPSRPAL